MTKASIKERAQEQRMSTLTVLNDTYGEKKASVREPIIDLLGGAAVTAVNLGIAFASIHFLHASPEITWVGAAVIESIPARRLWKGTTGLAVAAYDKAHYDERMDLLKKAEDPNITGMQDIDIMKLFDPTGNERTLSEILKDPFGKQS